MTGRGRAGWRGILALCAVAMLMIAVVVHRFSGGNHPAWAAPLTPVKEPDSRHQPVDCQRLPDQNRMVILVLGQSNAANHGPVGAPPDAPGTSGVYAFFAGTCYQAADPMPGTTGSGTSFLPKLGELLLDKRATDAVLFVPMAIESTRVEDWAEHPEIQRRLRDTLASLAARHIRLTHVLWQQGEADNNRNTTGEAYRQGLARFIRTLRAQGVRAPIFVAQASHCKGKNNGGITSAQAQVLDASAGILAGPNTDTLVGEEWRVDGCHFTKRGLDVVATMWSEALGR